MAAKKKSGRIRAAIEKNVDAGLHVPGQRSPYRTHEFWHGHLRFTVTNINQQNKNGYGLEWREPFPLQEKKPRRRKWFSTLPELLEFAKEKGEAYSQEWILLSGEEAEAYRNSR